LWVNEERLGCTVDGHTGKCREIGRQEDRQRQRGALLTWRLSERRKCRDMQTWMGRQDRQTKRDRYGQAGRIDRQVIRTSYLQSSPDNCNANEKCHL
jgi:hypothetical protein